MLWNFLYNITYIQKNLNKNKKFVSKGCSFPFQIFRKIRFNKKRRSTFTPQSFVMMDISETRHLLDDIDTCTCYPHMQNALIIFFVALYYWAGQTWWTCFRLVFKNAFPSLGYLVLFLFNYRDVKIGMNRDCFSVTQFEFSATWFMKHHVHRAAHWYN